MGRVVRTEGLDVTVLQVTFMKSIVLPVRGLRFGATREHVLAGEMMGSIPSVPQQIFIVTNMHYPKTENVNEADVSQ